MGTYWALRDCPKCNKKWCGTNPESFVTYECFDCKHQWKGTCIHCGQIANDTYEETCKCFSKEKE